MIKLIQDKCIGENIKRLRLANNMTQADLSAALSDYDRELSINMISLIENGKRNIFVSDLIRFQRIFNVSFDEFFVGI